MKIYPHWASHLPPLIQAVEITNGDVLEIGTGLYSTPILHWLCLDKDRKLVSYENKEKYFQLIKRFNTGNHQIIFIDDWNKMELEGKRWSVALIDHHPMRRRKDDVKRLKDNCDLVVVHDTEIEAEPYYNFRHRRRGIFQHFKFAYHYTKGGKPHTSVVSNFIDFAKCI